MTIPFYFLSPDPFGLIDLSYDENNEIGTTRSDLLNQLNDR